MFNNGSFSNSIIFSPRIPADPVSISIAMRNSQRIHVPEGQLEYGFKKKPIDGIRRKVFRNIPEERLHSLNKKVLELQQSDESEEDEFKIDDSDEEDDSPRARPNCERSPDGVFAYSDIGYKTTESRDRRFKSVPCSTTPNPCPPPMIDPECEGRIITLPEKSVDEEYAEYLAEYVAKHAPRELMTR